MVTPILNQFSKNSTVAQWNTQIRQAVNNGLTQKALFLYRQMIQTGISPNKFTFPFVAKACAKNSDVLLSKVIHAQILKSPLRFDIFVGTSVVDMYVKSGQLKYAHQVFDEMPQRDITSWNALLLGYVHSGFVDEFWVLFRRMRQLGVVPDGITVIGLTQLVGVLKDLRMVMGTHAFGIRVGWISDVSLANTLISAYSKCEDLIAVKGVFDDIDVELRTNVTWNSFIGGSALFEDCVSTFGLYRCMLYEGLRPDISTFLSLLSSCAKPKGLSCGKLIHSHVIRHGCDADVTVANSLLTMYSKCEDVDSAWQLFHNMTFKTCVSWTAMISGFAEKGDLDQAFSLFLDMQAAGQKPDAVTLVALLSGCGQTGSYELGAQLDDFSVTHQLRNSVIVCNAMIDMYAKCGFINKAKEIFQSMTARSIVTWTTMVNGLALNSQTKDAVDLFFKLVSSGLRPNHVTFLSILQACVHAGYLDRGWECFTLMTKVYNLNPWLEHYSCMVDLLGRKGKLKEAIEFIKAMPFKPDAGVWGSLLASSKIHRNLDIGEFAADRLYELEPRDAVSYVEMANIYASTGKWEGVSRVRAMMKCNEVKKSPGQSLILLNGKNHVFSVEERCHPQGLQIYEVLDVLTLQLKDDWSDLCVHELDSDSVSV